MQHKNTKVLNSTQSSKFKIIIASWQKKALKALKTFSSSSKIFFKLKKKMSSGKMIHWQSCTNYNVKLRIKYLFSSFKNV